MRTLNSDYRDYRSAHPTRVQALKNSALSWVTVGGFTYGVVSIIKPLQGQSGTAALAAIGFEAGVYLVVNQIFKWNLGIQKHPELVNTDGWNWATEAAHVNKRSFSQFEDFIFQYEPLTEIYTNEVPQLDHWSGNLLTNEEYNAEMRKIRKQKYEKMVAVPYPR